MKAKSVIAIIKLLKLTGDCIDEIIKDELTPAECMVAESLEDCQKMIKDSAHKFLRIAKEEMSIEELMVVLRDGIKA